MEFDLHRIFEDGYPGLAASAKIGSVGDYLKTVAEYLPLIQDQSTIRFRARLRAKYPELNDDDLSEEWESHDFTTQVQIPCYIGGSVVVAIWSAFECATNELCQYVSARESSPLKLNDLRESDLRKKIRKFIKILTKEDIEFPTVVSDIQLLRNIYAHHNGSLAKLDEKKMQQIRSIASTCNDIQLKGDMVVLGMSYICICYDVIDESLQQLLD